MKALALAVWLIACKGEPATRDLRPGPRIEIVYDINLEQAVIDRSDEIRRDLEARFQDDRIPATVAVGTAGVTVTLPDAARKAKVDAALKADYGDTITIYECGTQASSFAICFRISPSFASTLKATALANAVDTIRRRIDDKVVGQAGVTTRGDQIVVELPGIDADVVHATKDLLVRTGKLELKVVDDGSDYMHELVTHVAGDPGARDAAIRADVDRWTADDGSSHSDDYLVASDRTAEVPVAIAKQVGCWTPSSRDRSGKVECQLTGRQVLQRYVDDLVAKDPAFALPSDRELGFEQIEVPNSGVKLGPSPLAWRTYYLERAASLTGAAISNASASFEPTSNRPVVLLDLNRFGARVFGDLTTRIVGKKLATLLDGTIRSAPIVNGPIRGGRASITMGGTDPEVQQRAATDLVVVLKAGALPAPLRESSVTLRK